VFDRITSDNTQILDNYIKFNYGGFKEDSRIPQVLAATHSQVRTIEQIVNKTEIEIRNGVDLGCGYGRLTPWISDLCETQFALDANMKGLRKINENYENIRTISANTQCLPLHSDCFDFIFTGTVLQHMNEDQVKKTINEMKRISINNSMIIINERTQGPITNKHWPRKKEEYDELFNPEFKRENINLVGKTEYPSESGDIKTSILVYLN
jgi:ubiquinone/menaquinone biosynthesis C-methylase UbiE